MLIPYYICIALLTSCAQAETAIPGTNIHPTDTIASPDSISMGIFRTPGSSYTAARSRVSGIRFLWAEAYRKSTNKDSVLQAAGRALENALVKDIFPYWYGTPWDFEGHTDTPDTGFIACGYFVSTTLKHAGINLNRYKLARKSALTGCRILSITGDIIRLRNKSPQQVADYMRENLNDGLYSVGLDYHVGFVLLRDGYVVFIHSSFLNRSGVMATNAVTDPAFVSTNHILVPISTSAPLVKKWLTGEAIDILPDR
ncbi:MAG: hypothetical protein H6585_11350 [Flavobacteriales bacterium]|nr:hypothetical protein [Flavobacteriales bacterium]MCB9448930.1 hypothetical protein [Flavobacteriales bacterium]